jgi:hypothetical protein
MDRSENQLPSRRGNSAGWLVLSAGLNLLLAGLAVCFLTKPGSRLPGVRPLTTEHVERTETTNVAGAAVYVTNSFHWRQIESTNYDQYVANLRAVGCPEKTIRDIVIADIEKAFDARRLALQMPPRYWMAGGVRRRSDRERAAALESLDQEEASLVQRLLGIEWFRDADGRFGKLKLEDEAITRFFFGPMPEETLPRVLALLQKYEFLNGSVRSRAGEILIDEDETRLRQLRADMGENLGRILTPAQLEEMKARLSALQLFGENDMASVAGLSAGEAREIALTVAGVKDPLREAFGGRQEETDGDQEMQLTNQVRSILGDARFADFERAQDSNFRNVFEIGTANQVSRERVIEVYDLRRLAEEEAKHIRSDATLSEAARQQQFGRRQVEIQKEISRALGPKAFNDYLENGGGWVTNLTGL